MKQINGIWRHSIEAVDLAHHFGNGANIGVILGPRSGELVDVDLDCDEALMIARKYLPPTAAIFGRPAKPQSHWLYVARGAVSESFADPADGGMLVELRAAGVDGGAHQTIFPPSLAGGEIRAWDSETIAPAVVDARALRRRIAYLAVGSLVRRYISPYASERPAPDLLSLLWEFDRALARPAYRWFNEPTPDQPRQYPKAHRELSARETDLSEIVHTIPNDCGWDDWNNIGLAIYAVDNSEHGFIMFDDFSAKSPKYDPDETKARWRNYHRSPPDRTGLGKLAALARRHGWKPANAALVR